MLCWPHPTCHDPLSFLPRLTHIWALRVHPASSDRFPLPRPTPAPSFSPWLPDRFFKEAVPHLPFQWQSLIMDLEHYSVSQVQFDMVCEWAFDYHVPPHQVASSVRVRAVFWFTTVSLSVSTRPGIAQTTNKDLTYQYVNHHYSQPQVGITQCLPCARPFNWIRTDLYNKHCTSWTVLQRGENNPNIQLHLC